MKWREQVDVRDADVGRRACLSSEVKSGAGAFKLWMNSGMKGGVKKPPPSLQGRTVVENPEKMLELFEKGAEQPDQESQRPRTLKRHERAGKDDFALKSGKGRAKKRDNPTRFPLQCKTQWGQPEWRGKKGR